jgi:hypothetical protein
MNLDQLIKLAKLANNNPNEHEANAAAHKVCRIIEAGNYKFTQQEPAGSAGPRTWNDVRRSEEPFWRDTANPFADIINRMRKEEERVKKEQDSRQRDEQEKRRAETFRTGFYSSVDWGTPPKPPRQPMNWTWTGEDPDSKKRYKKDYVQKNRDCTSCNTTKLTTDESEPYICSNCQWIKWGEERSKQV